MHREHPLFFGAVLGLSLAVVDLLTDGPDPLRAARLDRQALVLLLSAGAGALLASLPGRFRGTLRMKKPVLSRCILAFFSGAGLILGLHMADTGRILPRVIEGSAAAGAFLGISWLMAMITLRLMGRRWKP